MHDSADSVMWSDGRDEWRPSSRELRATLLGDLAAARGAVLIRSGSRYGFAARALQMQGVVIITEHGTGKHADLEVMACR